MARPYDWRRAEREQREANLAHARHWEAIAEADPTPLNIRYYVSACRWAGCRPADHLTPSWYRPDGHDSHWGA